MKKSIRPKKTVLTSRPFVGAVLRTHWAKGLLCNVPDDYIQDRFNLVDLPTLKLEFGKLALSLVCGHYTISGEKLCSASCLHDIAATAFDDVTFQNMIWHLAIKTYFFIHQRWLQTPEGLEAVHARYTVQTYGHCSRSECQSQGLLPGVKAGTSKIMNNNLIKFCPHCNEQYDCDNLYNHIGDAFGPNFIANFLISYPCWTLPGTKLQHRISGFLIHPTAFSHQHHYRL